MVIIPTGKLKIAYGESKEENVTLNPSGRNDKNKGPVQLPTRKSKLYDIDIAKYGLGAISLKEKTSLKKGPLDKPTVYSEIQKNKNGKGAIGTSDQTSLSKGPLEQPTCKIEFEYDELESNKKKSFTRSIHINLHPMKNEYYEFTEFIYKFKSGESLYTTAQPTTIYPRINVVPGASPEIV